MGSNIDKVSFYNELCEHSNIEKKRQLMICGDMNATGNYGVSFIGGKNCCISEANDNGNRYGDFLIIKELALMNTWFPHKKLHRDTWSSRTGTFSKTIDYVAVSRWLTQYIMDCRVRTSFVFGNSDHRLLICRMKTPRRKIDRTRYTKKEVKTKFNINSLKNEDIKGMFLKKVNELCQYSEPNSFGVDNCKEIVEILENAGTAILPKKEVINEKYIWDNDEILLTLYRQQGNMDRNVRRKSHDDLSRKIKKRLTQLKNIYYEKQAMKLNEAYEKRNIEKMFYLSKKKIINSKPREQQCPGLKEHFSNHFCHPAPSECIPEEILQPPDFILKLKTSGHINDQNKDEYLQHPPLSNEIITNIKSLKNNRASTDIPAEFLKAAKESTKYISLLESLYREVWQDMVVACYWRQSTITSLYKNKGKRSECKNYRGLSISSTFLKLAMNIILNRIRPWYNNQILHNQTGFRQFYGCPDAIFTVKSIHHNTVRHGNQTYLLFIDLTAAYDWCVRVWLFHSIYNRIDPDDESTRNCIKIMEELYRKTESVMKGEEQYFETTSGVRQGGSESPILFNLFLDYIMRVYNYRAKELELGVSYRYRFKDQVRERGEKYKGQGEFYWVGYADDLVLTAKDLETMQKCADIISELLGKYGLCISIDKTKTMILNHPEIDYPDSIIKINGTSIENVMEFKYLGAVITYDDPGTCNKELDKRIGMANAKFSSLKKLLCNYRIKLTIRIRFYEAYVRTRLCYCCETWTLTKRQLKRIESTHINFLRRMIRGGMKRKSTKEEIERAKENSDWKDINWGLKITNISIMEISNTPSMEEYIHRQNDRWIAHICRQPKEALTKQLMFTDEKFSQVGRRKMTVFEQVIDRQYQEYGKSAEAFLRECYMRKR